MSVDQRAIHEMIDQRVAQALPPRPLGRVVGTVVKDYPSLGRSLVRIGLADHPVIVDRPYLPAPLVVGDRVAVERSRDGWLMITHILRRAADADSGSPPELPRYPTMASVKDFDAVGDGVTDDRQAFARAHAEVVAGAHVFVPDGDYRLSEDLNVLGRVFEFEGSAATVGPGSLLYGIIIRTDPDNGSLRYDVPMLTPDGTQNVPEYWSFRFGRSLGGASGLRLGGGSPKDGPDGTNLFADNWAGFPVIQNSKYMGVTHATIQSAAAAGRGSCTSGGTTLTHVSGHAFSAELANKVIYVGTMGGYYVSSVNVGAQTLEVAATGGGPSTFSSTGTYTWVVGGIYCEGTCDVTSGGVAERVSGDPFQLTVSGSICIVDGVSYAATWVDYDHINLAGWGGGDVSGVRYETWTDQESIQAGWTIQRLSAGVGFEETLVISANAEGYYRIYTASGLGGGTSYDYPLYIGSGQHGGGIRQNIGLMPNGDTWLDQDGTGAVRFGTHSAIGSETVTGYITIKDAGGTSRKLAVVS